MKTMFNLVERITELNPQTTRRLGAFTQKARGPVPLGNGAPAVDEPLLDLPQIQNPGSRGDALATDVGA